jgi:hypothetical protein
MMNRMSTNKIYKEAAAIHYAQAEPMHAFASALIAVAIMYLGVPLLVATVFSLPLLPLILVPVIGNAVGAVYGKLVAAYITQQFKHD